MIEWATKLWSGKTDITKSTLMPDSAAQNKMAVDESYFAVDLQGLSLAKDYQFLTEFSPFLAFVLEFGTGEAEKISVLFNPAEKLKNIGNGDSIIRPDVRGITIVPERPLRNDKVTMFGGMFREERNDAGVVLIDTLSQVAQAGLQLPGAGALKIAEIAYAGLKGLFNMKSNVGLATILRGFSVSNPEGDADRLIPGWLLILGDGELSPEQIEIVDGAPQPKDESERERFDHTDWLLLRFRCEPRRGRYNDLGFDPLWHGYQGALWAGNAVLADQEYKALNSAIVMCEHLIEEEKDVLLQDYHLKKLKEISRYKLTHGDTDQSLAVDRKLRAAGDAAAKDVSILLNEAAVAADSMVSLGSKEELASISAAFAKLALKLKDEPRKGAGPSQLEEITADQLDDLRASLGPANNPRVTSAVLSALDRP